MLLEHLRSIRFSFSAVSPYLIGLELQIGNISGRLRVSDKVISIGILHAWWSDIDSQWALCAGTAPTVGFAAPGPNLAGAVEPRGYTYVGLTHC